LSIKALIAEDESELLDLLADEIELAGFYVFKALDGHEALKALQENPDIQLIIIDIHMPNYNGLELLRNLKGQGLLDHLEVVVMSGGSELSFDPFFKTISFSFLDKPINFENLENLLSETRSRLLKKKPA
jgi:two-component system chemotaxis response regulator CheY